MLVVVSMRASARGVLATPAAPGASLTVPLAGLASPCTHTPFDHCREKNVDDMSLEDSTSSSKLTYCWWPAAICARSGVMSVASEYVAEESVTWLSSAAAGTPSRRSGYTETTAPDTGAPVESTTVPEITTGGPGSAIAVRVPMRGAMTVVVAAAAPTSTTATRRFIPCDSFDSCDRILFVGNWLGSGACQTLSAYTYGRKMLLVIFYESQTR